MATEAWGISAEGTHLLNAALQLPQREREILAERLSASVESNELDPGWEQAWADELDRRDAELDSGKVHPMSWEEVRQVIHEARYGKTGP
jgi:putative addiction module component (TIGR02574 family)